MKKLLSLLVLFALSSICLAQNGVYELKDYTMYVPDGKEYPITIPDSSLVIIEYSTSNDSCIVHRDTINKKVSFNLRLNDTNTLVGFTIYNECNGYGVKASNWIGIYPEGEANILFITDEYDMCSKYNIFDDNGKILRKGKFKNRIAVESLVDIPNGLYYLEVLTKTMKYIIEITITVNQY